MSHMRDRTCKQKMDAVLSPIACFSTEKARWLDAFKGRQLADVVRMLLNEEAAMVLTERADAEARRRLAVATRRSNRK